MWARTSKTLATYWESVTAKMMVHVLMHAGNEDTRNIMHQATSYQRTYVIAQHQSETGLRKFSGDGGKLLVRPFP
jgi:hypothetical protein